MSEASKIRYEICFDCERRVQLDGIGSRSSGFYAFLRKAFQFTFFFTARVLRPAADWHDMQVHKGPKFGEAFEEFVERVDNGFLMECQKIAETYSSFARLYLLGKAQDLRGMLKYNAGGNYPKTNCKFRAENFERKSMDIVSMLKEHKSKKAA
jgi:hypothetical protein